jgi:hypothetical protein
MEKNAGAGQKEDKKLTQSRRETKKMGQLAVPNRRLTTINTRCAKSQKNKDLRPIITAGLMGNLVLYNSVQAVPDHSAGTSFSAIIVFGPCQITVPVRHLRMLSITEVI